MRNRRDFDYEGHLNSWRNKELVTQTDTQRRLSSQPPAGYEEHRGGLVEWFYEDCRGAKLKSDPHIVLQPFGIIRGALHRPNGPGTNEDLGSVLCGSRTTRPVSGSTLAKHTVTDASGHFEFDQVPAGKLLISYRVKMHDGNGWMEPPFSRWNWFRARRWKWRSRPRQGRRRTGPISNRSRPRFSYRVRKSRAPSFCSDGKPAADAQVAVKVKGKYLSLGRAAFKTSDAWQDGSIVRAGADGGFTLPMYADAQTVIAVHEKRIYAGAGG